MSKRTPVMLDQETHTRLKKMADDARVTGISMGTIIKNLLNMVENRVNNAKKSGLIPTEHPDVLIKPETKTQTYSDYMCFLGLYLRDMGIMSEEAFQKNRDQLPFFVFALTGGEVALENFNDQK